MIVAFFSDTLSCRVWTTCKSCVLSSARDRRSRWEPTWACCAEKRKRCCNCGTTATIGVCPGARLSLASCSRMPRVVNSSKRPDSWRASCVCSPSVRAPGSRTPIPTAIAQRAWLPGSGRVRIVLFAHGCESREPTGEEHKQELDPYHTLIASGTENGVKSVYRWINYNRSTRVGTEVEADSLVSVAVSSGPSAVEVPDLIGRSCSEASGALAAAGLKLGNRGEHRTTTCPRVGSSDSTQRRGRRRSGVAP